MASLKDKAVSGGAWTAFEKIFNEVVQFVIGIVLARLLSPSDYGIVGLLAIFFAVASTFQDSGFASALIQKKDRCQSDFSTAFFFNVAISVVIYALFFVSAPYISAFYNVPILTDITRVSALGFIIGGLTGVQYAKLSAEMQFRTISILSMLGLVITGGAGIILALMGWGVWALVFQGLIGSFFKGIVVWVVSGWKPSLLFSRKSFKQLFSFGGYLMLSGLINTIYNNLYTLVIGKVYNPRTVGFYNRANGYAQIPTNLVLSMAVSVNYPILSSAQDDNERLKRAYRKLLRVPLYLHYPVLMGIAVLAAPLIEVMIGDKWLPCVPLLQILCMAGLFIPLTHINLNLLYVKGRSDLVFRLELIKKPLAFLILFASIPLGILWLVAGRVLYSFIGFCINCYYTKKILDYGFVDQIKVLIPVFINTAIMSGLVFVSIMFTENVYLKLCIGIPVGVISYWLMSVITKDESYDDVKEIFKSKIKHVLNRKS